MIGRCGIGRLFLLYRKGDDVIYFDGTWTSNYCCLGGITPEEIQYFDHALVRASLKSHGDFGYGVDDFFAGTVNREHVTLVETGRHAGTQINTLSVIYQHSLSKRK